VCGVYAKTHQFCSMIYNAFNVQRSIDCAERAFGF
jgi:hypothetical protein